MERLGRSKYSFNVLSQKPVNCSCVSVPRDIGEFDKARNIFDKVDNTFQELPPTRTL
jgi:hypothetical protein